MSLTMATKGVLQEDAITLATKGVIQRGFRAVITQLIHTAALIGRRLVRIAIEGEFDV